jgi:lipopolysaccharide assembly outer membrane protein LptD (OstA)
MKCVNYDYLFLKQAAFAYSCDAKNFSYAICSLFDSNHEQFIDSNNNSNSDNKETLEEFITKWMYFC